MTTYLYRPTPDDANRIAQIFGVAEAQIKRDFLISWVLHAIAQATDDVLFFGGTALSRTILPNLRLSEDIDLAPLGRRRDVADTVHRSVLTLERHFGEVTWDLALPESKHPATSIYTIDGCAIRIQLVDQHITPWPWHTQRLNSRYQGTPTVSMKTLTPEAFVAAKTAAWCDRNSVRDLYDLWALDQIGLLNENSGRLFARFGPTGRFPSSAAFPGHAPSEEIWQAELNHQGRIHVTAKQAYDAVTASWNYAN